MRAEKPQTYQVENWCLRDCSYPGALFENPVAVVGEVEGKPYFSEWIFRLNFQTATAQDVKGNTLLLGNPDAAWISWLKEQPNTESFVELLTGMIK